MGSIRPCGHLKIPGHQKPPLPPATISRYVASETMFDYSMQLVEGSQCGRKLFLSTLSFIIHVTLSLVARFNSWSILRFARSNWCSMTAWTVTISEMIMTMQPLCNHWYYNSSLVFALEFRFPLKRSKTAQLHWQLHSHQPQWRQPVLYSYRHTYLVCKHTC